MKKLVILLALFVGMSSAFANEAVPTAAKKVDVKVMDGLRFKLVIPELNDKGSLVIKNQLGEVIYREFIQGVPAFAKVYNLDGFPDGDYTFEVKMDKSVVSKEVTINTTVNRIASVH